MAKQEESPKKQLKLENSPDSGEEVTKLLALYSNMEYDTSWNDKDDVEGKLYMIERALLTTCCGQRESIG